MSTYLLLHAFPFDSSMWDGVADELRQAGHSVVAPDLPGFGVAPLADASPDVGAMSDAVLPLLGDEPAVVVGCSMGGYVALDIARRRPDLVRVLCLVDSRATADVEAVREHRWHVAQMADEGADWSTGMLEGLLGQTARSTRPDLVALVEDRLSTTSRTTVAWAQRAMARRPDARETLARLTTPVVAVVGAEDSMSPMAEQQIILDSSPDARVEVIPAVGHVSPLEAPALVARILLSLG